ncbi:hypothetical protein [Staphylococcus kloosii]|uniref:Uncharacterized protein n=1 Tax=Staphylococcus kloosii TaxID=29384 RepID=A0A151A6Y9_9STAP|nr:hypothetical protein [Staphylococcus kloosii]KYH14870.1 hypothetical protein A0131_08790 [Staphylococcus kloosii]
MPQENEPRYVLRTEWEKQNKKFTEDIHENTLAINGLRSEIEKSTIYAKQSYEVQKEMGTDIKELTKEMRSQTQDVFKLSETVKSHDNTIKGIQGKIETKQAGSVQIIVAIIGVSGVVITVAGTMLTHFF